MMIDSKCDLQRVGRHVDNQTIDKKAEVGDPREDGFVSNIRVVYLKYLPIHQAMKINRQDLFFLLIRGGARLNGKYTENDTERAYSEFCKNPVILDFLQFKRAIKYLSQLRPDMQQKIINFILCLRKKKVQLRKEIQDYIIDNYVSLEIHL